jgi:hypothetical protein
MACKYSFDGGNTYISEEKFIEELANGKLEEFINDKVIDISKLRGGKKPPVEPPTSSESEGKESLSFKNKSILKRMIESKNINEKTKEKFKQNLKYQVKSQDEARELAKNIIKEYGIDDAVELADANKFHGDVNAMIFNEALDSLYELESKAKTPQEKAEIASKWADISMRYDESARSQGRFISAIADFYRKSPLGFRLKEEAKRNEAFKDWIKNKEQGYKEVFEAIKEEPEFKELIKAEVEGELKKERVESRQKNRKKIEDFFDNAKLKGNNIYAVPIPPPLINGALEIMKKAVLAGESVTYAVNLAIEHISETVKDWDKEKFRKEYEEKLNSLEGKSKKSEVELTEEKKLKILERYRKKMKGLSDSEKEEVIRRAFKKLVENNALEYDDFKEIISDVIGLGKMDDVQKNQLEQYVKDINDVEVKAEEAREKRTDESLNDFYNASKKAEKSATELGRIVYSKPELVNRITSIMQLNTLGIPSLINNPIFNIFNQALVRFPKSVIVSVLDKMISSGAKALGKEYQPQTNVLLSQIPFWQGAKEGGKQSIEQFWNGMTNKDYFQKEVKTAQIHPFTSMGEIWDFVKGKKHLSWKQVIDKGLQGTVGVPAEIVARSLNIGDKYQRFGAEKAEAKIIANDYGLKGLDEKIFFTFPKEEAYRIEISKGASEEVAKKRAEEVEKRIISAGEESTFQQENIINNIITGIGKAYDNVANENTFFKTMGKVGQIIKVMNMPFIKIPLNSYWSYLNLVNPELALMQSFVYGGSAAIKKIKGREGASNDFEQSKKWFAHAATGMALLSVAGMLAKQGLIKGSNDKEDTKKEREGEKAFEQQHTILINGLNIDLKWFGVLGNILNLQANKLEQMTPEQRQNGIDLIDEILYNAKVSSLEQFDNGVFSNASSLINALHNGGAFADAYAMNLFNMGTNIFQPAMFAQLSRAQMPYDYTTKADSFIEELKNNMAARSGVVRVLTGHYPPSKIGIWGDEIKRSDDVFLRYFSISKNNKNNFAQPIYEDYKKTGDIGFFPPAVKSEINGIKLNTEQARKLQILIGQERKKSIEPYVNNMAEIGSPLFYGKKYKDLSIERKKDALRIIYELGAISGKEKFLLFYPEFKKPVENEYEKEIREEENDELRENLKYLLKIED